MEKLRTNMDKWFAKMDERWKALPVGKQHKYTLYFFTGYLLLTAGVIFKVWSDTAKSDNSIVIKHIENPVLKMKDNPTLLQVTLKKKKKNKIYERR